MTHIKPNSQINICDNIYNALSEFLTSMDSEYPTPLSSKVKISEFAEKLLRFADIFTDFDNGKMVSCVAVYATNAQNKAAYITLVGTLAEYRGQKLAYNEILRAIEFCENQKLNIIHLHTAKSNIKAIKLYKSLGFEEYIIENEPRPNDLHLYKSL